MDKYPFLRAKQVINYYLHCNPARQVHVDVLARNQDRERDPDDTEEHPRPFSDNPEILWLTCKNAIFRGLEFFPAEQRQAFELRYMTEFPEDARSGKPGISMKELVGRLAKQFSTSTRTIYSWLNAVMDQIEHEAISRGLVPKEARRRR